MNEQNERNLENNMPEVAENKEMQNPVVEESAVPAAEALQSETAEEKENTTDEAQAPAEDKPAGKKKSKKKHKKRGVAVPVAAVLLVIALVFGTVVGYTFGRSVGVQRLEEAELLITELTAALEEAQATPVYDAFEEELTEENQAALADLSGYAFLDDGGDAMMLMEEDSFGASGNTSTEAPVVVAEYNGGRIMSDEAAREYGEQMTSFVFAGYSEEEIADVLLDEVLRYMVSDRVLEAHAKEMGLYELTDEDQAQIKAEALKNYNEQLDFYRSFVNTDGMTEEEANGAVKAYLKDTAGITLEVVTAEIESGWWMQKIYDEITRDVSVDDADVQAAYDKLLAQQKESFKTYPDDFEFAQRNGETIVYNLPGYRAVRMLLFGFDDSQAYEAVPVLSEEIAELNPDADAALIAEYRAQLDGFFAPAQKRAQEALNQLQAGADFAEMLENMGEDAGMADAALRETGYYVSKDSLLWSKEMISAAMALEKPGDISGLVRTAEGVCILEYVGEVPAGEVELEEVRAALERETLESARYNAYEAQVNQWLKDANAVYYPERMQ